MAIEVTCCAEKDERQIQINFSFDRPNVEICIESPILSKAVVIPWKKILVLEGPDGVGKTYTTKLIKDTVEANGYDVRILRYPGNRGTLNIRDILMSEEIKKYPLATPLLFMTDFVHSFELEIQPELNNPKVLFLLDRFIPSTVVYQDLKIPYLNLVYKQFEPFYNAFKRAHYLYLIPENVGVIQQRLSQKSQAEINHRDPKSIGEMIAQMNAYATAQKIHQTVGICGSYNVHGLVV